MLKTGSKLILKSVFALIFLFAAVTANACDNPTRVSHPSAPTASYPDRTLWEIGLGWAMIEAGLTANLIHCVRYSDGVREKVLLIRTTQYIGAKQEPGTRVPASQVSGGANTTCTPTITIYGDYFTTTTTQGGQVIGQVTEFIGSNMETSGCEFVPQGGWSAVGV